MTLKQPQFIFTFTQKAKSFKERSKNNIIMFVVEPTLVSNTTFEFETLEDAEKKQSTFAENMQYIRDCFFFSPAPNLVTVYALKESPTDVSAFETLLDDVKKTREIAYVIYPKASTELQAELVTWAKATESTNKTFKTIVSSATAPDSTVVVNLDPTQTVVYADTTRTETDIKSYIPSLASVLAGSGASRGVTYTKLTNLKRVTEPTDVDTSINAGHLVLINDEADVRIALGINSKTTLEDDEREDIKYLEVTETVNLMKRDISNVFKNNYVGAGKKNNPDTQSLFLTDVNNYFIKLEEENILYTPFQNYAEIDTETQRQAWIDSGVPEASTWDDTQVKNSPFRRDIFIKAQIKISNSVINLKFNTTLN